MTNEQLIAVMFNMNNAATRIAAHFKGIRIMDAEKLAKQQELYNACNEQAKKTPALNECDVVIKARERYNRVA